MTTTMTESSSHARKREYRPASVKRNSTYSGVSTVWVPSSKVSVAVVTAGSVAGSPGMRGSMGGHGYSQVSPAGAPPGRVPAESPVGGASGRASVLIMAVGVVG
ncbi:hypothetical protein MFU01_38400 [Myxococcus fulvus]|uniref:Uncharacterized protein n=1 Tax=Myxococcus fulvus TaxID=33 RepID=A0A511T5A6_MYXFU|nr:hypothetical protein MFU01_38400 [Myxococcus fulvus]